VARTPLPEFTPRIQISEEIQTLDPALPVINVRSMVNDLMDASMRARFLGDGSGWGVFRPVAMLLSLYWHLGLLDYMGWQRSREIGIESLGSPRGHDFVSQTPHSRQRDSARRYWNCDGLSLSAISAPLIAGPLYGVHLLM